MRELIPNCDETPALSRGLFKILESKSGIDLAVGKLETSPVGIKRRYDRLSLVATGADVDGNSGRHSEK
jgi:hypothetical protein